MLSATISFPIEKTENILINISFRLPMSHYSPASQTGLLSSKTLSSGVPSDKKIKKLWSVNASTQSPAVMAKVNLPGPV